MGNQPRAGPFRGAPASSNNGRKLLVAPPSSVKRGRDAEREEVVGGPEAVGPAGGHGGRPLSPLLALELALLAQALVQGAGVVGAAGQVRPPFQGPFLLR